MIASAPASKTMVYNAFAKFNLGGDVGPYMMSKVTQGDAEAAYKAFLEFKDVVSLLSAELLGDKRISSTDVKRLSKYIFCHDACFASTSHLILGRRHRPSYSGH